MAETGWRSRVGRAWSVAMATAAVALVAGLTEALVHGVRSGLLAQFTWTSREIGWMAPLSYLAFLLVATAPIVLVAVIRPWKLTPVAVGLSSAMAVFALIRLVTLQRLHVVAMAAIAVAVGYQLGRLVSGSPERTNRTASRLVAALGLIVGLLGVGQWAVGRIQERRGIAQLPPAPAGAPNVLLLVLDTVRGENLGTYGYGRPTTPWIDGFAARGAVFEYPISASPWTLPSHATMFTGRAPWEHGATFRQRLDNRFPTLAEYFRDRGYLTAGFVGNHLYTHHETGLDRGFGRYRDYPISVRQVLLSSEIGQMISSQQSKMLLRAADRPAAPTVNRWFLDWLDSASAKDRPVFAFLNFMDAHVPYRTPAEWQAKFTGGHPLVDRYDAALGYLDDQLRQLFEALAKRGALSNTIVVITADHGEHLGDHRMDDHANSLYLQLLRVPLIIVDPRTVAAGTRVRQPVGLIDLGATIVDLATGDGVGGGFQGRAFRRQVEEGASVSSGVIVSQVDQHPLRRSWFRNALGPMWSVVDGGSHLIENPDGHAELYDVVADPAEAADFAESGDRQEQVRRLRAVLDSVRKGR